MPTHTQRHDPRQQLLAAFKFTDGTKPESWTMDKPIREWHGVTTNEGGEIVQLSTKGIRGLVEWTQLPLSLSTVDLEYNQFTRTIDTPLESVIALVLVHFVVCACFVPVASWLALKLGNDSENSRIKLATLWFPSHVELWIIDDVMAYGRQRDDVASELGWHQPTPIGKTTQHTHLYICAEQLADRCLVSSSCGRCDVERRLLLDQIEILIAQLREQRRFNAELVKELQDLRNTVSACRMCSWHNNSSNNQALSLVLEQQGEHEQDCPVADDDECATIAAPMEVDEADRQLAGIEYLKRDIERMRQFMRELETM